MKVGLRECEAWCSVMTDGADWLTTTAASHHEAFPLRRTNLLQLSQPWNCLWLSLHQDPVIHDIFPTFGPKSGNTMLTIRGAFLDTGNKAEVTVGKAVCEIQRSVQVTFIFLIQPDCGADLSRAQKISAKLLCKLKNCSIAQYWNGGFCVSYWLPHGGKLCNYVRNAVFSHWTRCQ